LAGKTKPSWPFLDSISTIPQPRVGESLLANERRKSKDSTEKADKFLKCCRQSRDLKATRCLEKLHSAASNKMKEEVSPMAESAKWEVHPKRKENDLSSL
jgi:hypothetical protein